METYFHNDSRIPEWIDQIIEEVFTVCLLKGTDAETEFNKGAQIVTKLTALLQNISAFPEEYLEEAVKQLIEQQLPDARITNNFSAFHDIKNRMLNEGIAVGIATPINEEISYPADSLEPLKSAFGQQSHTVASTEGEMAEAEIPLNQEQENDKLDIEGITPVFAASNQLVKQDLSKIEMLGAEQEEQNEPPQETLTMAEATMNEKLLSVPVIAQAGKTEMNLVETSRQSADSGAMPQVSEEQKHLQRVLSTIYPKKSIQWNVKIADQCVFAQVENLIICLDDPNNPCDIKKMNRQGWKVYVCNSEDLLFPRRVERGIRQILRVSKQKVSVD
ncbi:hypothetical protein REC12_15110 [Desulfosporosinus sp. PR]|uniref:hypothetical protein n=1 Tax=Candidatus Desulfosporosinus nitrosoreducens TaxID=3401928 RepID=UPI0027EC1534|nr:hypothetical protein [Desulfosporosinus sp. PR]MDQ7094925.1 hypothetical protein [Desulfosporosinus sp. PR]